MELVHFCKLCRMNTFTETPRSKSHLVTLTGLSIALLSVSALVTVPFGPVPFTLQTLVVVLVSLVLPPAAAAGAVAGYLALGALGMPVFSGGNAGFGVLLGPTGGFLYGFLIAVVLASMLRTRLARSEKPGRPVNRTRAIDALCASVVIVVVYVCGASHLAITLGLTAGQAIAAGVAPFILLDIAKAFAAVSIARAVRVALRG